MSKYAQAIEYFERGWNVIPLAPKSKSAIVEWKIYQERRSTRDEIKRWFLDTPNNIAIVTGSISDLVVVDCDNIGAIDKYFFNCDASGLCVDTARGLHFYHTYSPIRNIQRNGLDIRADGGYVVAPPSIHPSGFVYTWESKGAPTKFDPRWFAEDRTLIPRRQISTENAGDAVERCRAYVAKIDPAISGQNGHRVCFRAACKVAEFVGSYMSPEEALSLMIEYNDRCEPPFTERELLHKLQDAFKLVRSK